MKKYLTIALLSLAIACNKTDDTTRPEPTPVTDAQPIALKSTSTTGLPSPYFNYTYNTNKFVTHIQHAAGLLQYELQYENNRIVKIWNTTIVNKDTLQYHYTNNKVSSIELIEPGTGITKTIELLYNDKQQLKELRWKQHNADFSTSIVRKLIFTYDGRGNVSQYEDHRNHGNGLELLQTHFYDQYDNETNVEHNYIIKDPFEHFLFLPQIQLQKNNPLSERITGTQNDWAITYNYTFNNKLPVSKTTTIRQTRGNGPGGTISTTTTYNY